MIIWQRSAGCSAMRKRKQCATVSSEILKLKRYKMSPVQNDYFLHFKIVTLQKFCTFFNLFESQSLSKTQYHCEPGGVGIEWVTKHSVSFAPFIGAIVLSIPVQFYIPLQKQKLIQHFISLGRRKAAITLSSFWKASQND